MIPDHPVVTRLILTGSPDNKDTYPICPICFYECEEVYFDKYGDCFGCDQCVSRKDAWDTPECFGQ